MIVAHHQIISWRCKFWNSNKLENFQFVSVSVSHLSFFSIYYYYNNIIITFSTCIECLKCWKFLYSFVDVNVVNDVFNTLSKFIENYELNKIISVNSRISFNCDINNIFQTWFFLNFLCCLTASWGWSLIIIIIIIIIDRLLFCFTHTWWLF